LDIGHYPPPKFEISTNFEVDENLKAMGIKSIFDSSKSDLDKMIIKKFSAYRVYINKISHDAWIKVNEQGTEAVAATTSMNFSIGCSAPIRAPFTEFHADHPFVYFIIHNKSQSILFTGWINEP
jgi:serpin B